MKIAMAAYLLIGVCVLLVTRNKAKIRVEESLFSAVTTYIIVCLLIWPAIIWIEAMERFEFRKSVRDIRRKHRERKGA